MCRSLRQPLPPLPGAAWSWHLDPLWVVSSPGGVNPLAHELTPVLAQASVDMVSLGRGAAPPPSEDLKVDARLQTQPGG